MAVELVRNVASKIDECMQCLKRQYEKEGYSVYFLDVFNGDGESMSPSVVVTNCLTGGVKSTLGLTTIAQVVFVKRHNDVEVLDNPPRFNSNRATAIFVAVASGGAGFPLLITSSIGAIRQRKLRHRLFADAVNCLQV